MITVTDLSTTASLIGELFMFHIFRASLDATTTYPPSKDVSFTSSQNCENSKQGCSLWLKQKSTLHVNSTKYVRAETITDA